MRSGRHFSANWNTAENASLHAVDDFQFRCWWVSSRAMDPQI